MSTKKEEKMVNIQKIGDELLTAYVNEEFEKVTQIWSKAGYETWSTITAIHQYSNPAITDVGVRHVLTALYSGSQPPSPIAMHENGWITRTTYDAILKEIRHKALWPCETPIWDSVQEKTKHMWQK